MNERSEGERTRLRHALSRHAEHLRSLAFLVEQPHEIPSPDVGQALVLSALEIATTLARMSAYQRSEEDK